MAAPAGAAAAAQDAAANGDSWGLVKSVGRSILIFGAVQFGARYIMGGDKAQANKPAIPSVQTGSDAPRVVPTAVVGQYNPIPQTISPLWPLNSSLDMSIYVAPSLAMPPLRQMPASSLVLQEKDIQLDDYKSQRSIDASFPVPKEVQNGGTLWAHIYIALHGHELDPSSSAYDIQTAYQFSRPLNHELPRKKKVKTKKLLGNEDESSEELEVPSEPESKFASYYHPNFTMSFIPDSGTLRWPMLHAGTRQHIVLEKTGARDETGQNGWYYPILFTNTFWQLRDHMTELNNTVKELPFHVDLYNMANWKYSLFSSVDENVKANARNVANGGAVGAAGDGSEFEEFKRILLDSNPYLLGTTFVVSILHMIFEMLAFKNDVSHWRNKKDNVGISFRAIVSNVVMQLIIFLYLMDNNEHTSWMILFSQGMGIAIEAWKITKTVNVKIGPTAPGSLIPYTIKFEDKHKLSETEKKTQEYDEIAFKYLYIVAVPLLLAYAIYSVLYDTHKSWYSFVITTLVGSVYAYGFLMMVPSLYINYRLKSVAHMPGKAMFYKFLNTFIDDLFAFTIKMPTLHRLATLRDDVIFFIYLYQTWAYKIDHTRVNEFGQGGDDEELEEKKANAPLKAAPDADASVGTAVATGSQKKTATKRK